MKKKLITGIVVVALACFGFAALAGCGGGQSSNQSSDKSNDSKTTLIVGFDSAYPPYGFVGDDGQYTGFDLDLAQEVANRNGWDYKAEPVDWDAKDALLGSGQINCIWNGFTIEGREDNYTFSEPYMLNEQVVVVKKNSGINSLSDLKGKTVMTQVDSAALDVLEGDQKALADTFKGGKAQRLPAAQLRCRRCGRLRPVHRPVPDRRVSRQLCPAARRAVDRALRRWLQEGRHRDGRCGHQDPEGDVRGRHGQDRVRKVRAVRPVLRQLAAQVIDEHAANDPRGSSRGSFVCPEGSRSLSLPGR